MLIIIISKDVSLSTVNPRLKFKHCKSLGASLNRKDLSSNTIPKELDEAAEIDGCTFFQIFCKIVLPVLKPILATIAIIPILVICIVQLSTLFKY
jgi:hypothetical protein